MSVTGLALVKTAATKLGKPYVFGAEGPNAFDCSGLMQWAYAQHGLKLPRVTGDQVRVGQAIAKGMWQPGDLVFSSWDGKPHSHVGMYAGDNKIIVAPSTGKNVQYTTLGPTYMSKIDAVRRVPGVEGYTGSGGKNQGGAGAPDGGGLIPGVPDPGDLVDDGTLVGAVRGAAGALTGIASSAAGVGRFADKLMFLALPTTWTRIVSGVLGLAFLFIGIGLLGREALKK